MESLPSGCELPRGAAAIIKVREAEQPIRPIWAVCDSIWHDDQHLQYNPFVFIPSGTYVPGRYAFWYLTDFEVCLVCEPCDTELALEIARYAAPIKIYDGTDECGIELMQYLDVFHRTGLTIGGPGLRWQGDIEQIYRRRMDSLRRGKPNG